MYLTLYYATCTAFNKKLQSIQKVIESTFPSDKKSSETDSGRMQMLKLIVNF